jgi:hypothetical protein
MSTSRPTVHQVYFSDINHRSDLEQEELEKNFFFRIRLQNGVSKTTYSQRFNDLNDLVNDLLPRHQPLQLMDVAVSSGISTIEWVKSLNTAGVNHHMVASDVAVKAFLLNIHKYLHILVDKTGYPLQFDLFNFAIPASPRNLVFCIFVYPCKVVAGIFAKIALNIFNSQQPAPYKEAASGHNPSIISCHPVFLVSPRLKQSSDLNIIEDDIISNQDSDLQNRFHAIRAANILNSNYFDQNVIIKILHNLRRRLVAEGLLIICRTDIDGTNHGTVFRLKETRAFEVEKRLGKGSEIEDLVLELE